MWFKVRENSAKSFLSFRDYARLSCSRYIVPRHPAHLIATQEPSTRRLCTENQTCAKWLKRENSKEQSLKGENRITRNNIIVKLTRAGVYNLVLFHVTEYIRSKMRKKTSRWSLIFIPHEFLKYDGGARMIMPREPSKKGKKRFDASGYEFIIFTQHVTEFL